MKNILLLLLNLFMVAFLSDVVVQGFSNHKKRVSETIINGRAIIKCYVNFPDTGKAVFDKISNDTIYFVNSKK